MAGSSLLAARTGPWHRQVLAWVLVTCIFYRLPAVSGLECYVCNNQDGNTDKCLRTIQTCEQEHDRCLSTIRWSTTPYWSQGAEKQYYVSKSCSTSAECEREIYGNMPLCHYIWYEDWKCAECCQGDRCNYFITLGAGSMRPNKYVYLGTSVLLAVSGLYLFRS